MIVPEGIIFQSAKAYKQLRKMLVENSLIAVVSLPAGVFQPYSGVKTSILIMDKQLAKKTDSILFVKVENDGFDLGAQRRPIDKNDLPDALSCLQEWKRVINSDNQEKGEINRDIQDGQDNGNKKSFLSSSSLLNSSIKSGLALLVKKEKLAENKEYNLTGDRYREVERRTHQKWPMVKLGEVCEIVTPPKKVQKSEYLTVGKIPIIDQSKIYISGYTNDEQAIIIPTTPYIIFGDHTCIVKYVDFTFAQGADGIKILSPNKKVIPKYFYYFLRNNKIESDGYKRHFSKLKELQFPLPPLSVQQEIVAEIEGYQKIIDGCRQVIDNWKPDVEGYLEEELIKFNRDIQDGQDNDNKKSCESCSSLLKQSLDSWPMVRLGEVCEIFAGGDVPKEYSKEKNNIFKFPIFTNGTNEKALYGFAKEYKVNKTAVTISARGTIGYPELRNDAFYPAIRLIVCLPNYKLNALYLKYILGNIDFQKTGNTIKQLTVPMVKQVQIPLPPLSVQKHIVDRIESERKVIDGCRELIKTCEEKIKRVIGKVWGE